MKVDHKQGLGGGDVSSAIILFSLDASVAASEFGT